MPGLQMRYFVLNPRSKQSCDPYAFASRCAMTVYAEAIEEHDKQLAKEIRAWVKLEIEKEKRRKQFKWEGKS